MTAEHYARLRKADDPRRAYEAGEAPPELADLFKAEIDKLASGAGDDD